MLYAHRLELQDAQHGYIESRREQVRPQEELSMKVKVLRDAQIRRMHEMGVMRRAQELRVGEISVNKLRGNHETIQKLNSQLQTPTTLLEHDEHLGPYEPSHRDDLRQSGGFTQTVTPTAYLLQGMIPKS